MFKRLENKTILVTGSKGFIGSHLVSRLQDIPQTHLLLLSRQTPSNTSHKGITEGITEVRASLGELSPQTWKAIGIDKIDIVFHMGAFTPKTGAEANRVDRIYDDNLIGTRALLESLPSSPEKIVFSSTLDVYATPQKGDVLTEESAVKPGGLYGASKLFCEQLLQTQAQVRGYGLAILRYGHIFGPGEESYRKLIPETIRQLLRGEAPVLYGDGSAERDFLYVADAVEATLRAACEVTEPTPINIVRGASTTIRETTEILMRLTGFSGEIKYLSDKPTGHSMRFSNTKMRQVLGQWPFISLPEGLRCELEHFRNTEEYTNGN